MNEGSLLIQELRNNHKFRFWQHRACCYSDNTQSFRVGFAYDLDVIEFCMLLATVRMWKIENVVISADLLEWERNIEEQEHMPLRLIMCSVIWCGAGVAKVGLSNVGRKVLQRVSPQQGRRYREFVRNYWSNY